MPYIMAEIQVKIIRKVCQVQLINEKEISSSVLISEAALLQIEIVSHL